jgi:hypothetical protein
MSAPVSNVKTTDDVADILRDEGVEKVNLVVGMSWLLSWFRLFLPQSDLSRWAWCRSVKVVCLMCFAGIDFTRSNLWSGLNTFGGKCLHAIDPTGQIENPYQQAIRVIGSCRLWF